MKHASRKIHEDVLKFSCGESAVLRGLDLQKQAAEKMAAINAQDTVIAMALLAWNKSLDLIDARIHEPFKQ